MITAGAMTYILVTGTALFGWLIFGHRLRLKR